MNINTNEYIHTDMFNINNYLENSNVISGCLVSAHSPNNDTIDIQSGVIKLNGQIISVSAQNLQITPASSGKYKYALVRINNSGVASVVYGDESTNDDINNPLTIPDYDPDNYLLLARVKRSSVSTIYPSDIKDMRTIYNSIMNSLRLTNQTIDSGVSIGNAVYSDSGVWKKAGTNKPVGIYEGNNVVVLKGICNLSNLQQYRFYFMQTDGTISTTQTDYKVGYTLSSTQLLVDIDIEGNS